MSTTQSNSDTAASAYASARALAADVAAGRASASELVDRAIGRIERLDGAINAVVVRDFDRARDAAREADAALRRGERRPLLGVPITVKESYGVAGLPTTWGMPWFAGERSSEDSVVVARLKAAGAIVLGKTNVPVALGDWQSFNPIYGVTNNPWQLDRSPGGSSGGSAASLAAGYVPLEMGSDIGGSLRAPAHFCGVCSHKPSRGVIPGRGHAPPGVFGGTPDLSVVGPLARDVADLELAFDIVAGPDVVEAAGARVALPPSRYARLRDFRVLALDTHPLMPADRATRAAMVGLVDRLRAEGVIVETASPLVPDLVALGRAFVGLLMPVVFARRPPEALAAMSARAAALPADADTPDAWMTRAAVASHREWLVADEARVRAAYAWHELFGTFDVVLYPPMPTPAFLQDRGDPQTRTIDIDGVAHPYDYQLFYASLATAAGLPATTIPIARSERGLPVGVQIVGPFLEDRTTLRFAACVEEAFGGFVPPPSYA